MTAEGAGGNTLAELKRVLNVDNLDVRSEFKDVQAALRYRNKEKKHLHLSKPHIIRQNVSMF